MGFCYKKCKEAAKWEDMKVLLLDWNAYGGEDIKAVFTDMGYILEVCPFPDGIRTSQKQADELLLKILEEGSFDFVFSFNYIPVVSNCCLACEVAYVSWVYDSPYIHVYSYTVLNPCNFIFLFDYAVYEELRREGISTVYYLPLAVNEKRLGNLACTDAYKQKYQADVSFVGSLYDEPKHRIYDKFRNISPYAKGYLDAIVKAQKNIYGYNFLQGLLSEDIVKEMQKAYPTDPNAKTVMSPEAIYAEYVLARQVTAMERREILEMLGKKADVFQTVLYTNNPDTYITGIANKGIVDYYDAMPYVFMNSKINLNITLKSIKTGIPLRAFDIMGSGGFLLTNYQPEMAEYFVPDEDFVYYDSYDGLLEKVEYYLSHEKERIEIAQNGANKVRTEHTMKKRIEEMVKVLCS